MKSIDNNSFNQGHNAYIVNIKINTEIHQTYYIQFFLCINHDYNLRKQFIQKYNHV